MRREHRRPRSRESERGACSLAVSLAGSPEYVFGFASCGVVSFEPCCGHWHTILALGSRLVCFSIPCYSCSFFSLRRPRPLFVFLPASTPAQEPAPGTWTETPMSVTLFYFSLGFRFVSRLVLLCCLSCLYVLFVCARCGFVYDFVVGAWREVAWRRLTAPATDSFSHKRSTMASELLSRFRSDGDGERHGTPWLFVVLAMGRPSHWPKPTIPLHWALLSRAMSIMVVC